MDNSIDPRATAKADPWDGFITDEERDALNAASAKVQTHEQDATQIFRQNAKAAAEVICAIALGAQNERVRLDAAKYVTDRVLGRVGEQKALEQTGAPWDEIYGAVTREPTAEERSRGASVGR